MKKAISLIMAICMVFTLLPTFDVTVKAATYDETAYTLTGDQLEDMVGIAKTQVGYCEGNNSSQLYGTL